jgi:hypothetical protein
MKSKLLSTACLLALSAVFMSGSSAAQVVDASRVRDGQAQSQPHSHVKEKIGSAPTDPAKPGSAIKATKPVHDHRSFHKH